MGEVRQMVLSHQISLKKWTEFALFKPLIQSLEIADTIVMTTIVQKKCAENQTELCFALSSTAFSEHLVSLGDDCYLPIVKIINTILSNLQDIHCLKINWQIHDRNTCLM